MTTLPSADAPLDAEVNWSLARLVGALFRYKWRALLVVLLAGLAAVGALRILPEEYASEAKLLVRVGRENAALDPTITADTIAMTASREVEMNSILEHLRSRTLIEKTLDATDPQARELPALVRDASVRSLEKRLFVDSPKSSAVIVLHCESTAAEEAQQTLSAFIEVFLDEHMRVNHSTGSHAFFVTQCEALKEQVDAARAKLRDAKISAGMASLDGQRVGLEQQISQAEMRMAEIRAALSASEAKTTELAAALQDVPDVLLAQFVEGTPNDGLATMRHTLFELRALEEEVLSKYEASHPRVRSVRAQVRNLEQTLKNSMPERGGVQQAVLIREEAEAKALEAELKSFESQLERLTERLKRLNADEGRIETLSNELALVESRYQVYASRMEQARIDEALHADRITNVSLMQEASLVPTAIRPRKSAVLLLALVVGGLLGVGLALLSEQLAEGRQVAAAHLRTAGRGSHSEPRVRGVEAPAQA